MMKKTDELKRTVVLLFSFILLFGCAFSQEGMRPVLFFDKQSGQPLTGVTIQSSSGAIRLISDNRGRVMMPVAPLKKDEIFIISMIGYKKMKIGAEAMNELKDIELEQQIDTLEEVIITHNSPMGRVRNIQMGSEVITAAEARKLPAILGEVDIIKILQLKPGIKSAGEGLAGFYVRGGGADQNLILIDGTPVYNPNHLLGLFSVFNTDAIKDVTLFKSAYPAKYGGRLSSVLDVTTRQGSTDSLMISGGVGLLSSRLSVESPIKKGKSSMIISGRRTYFDIFTRAVNGANKEKKDYQAIPAYFFSDINLRTDWKVNDRNTIWATGYWGSDNFRSEEDNYSARFTWGNKAASVNWRSVLKTKTEITSAIFYSGYQYQLGHRSGFNDLELRSGINTFGMRMMASGITSKSFRWQTGMDGMIHQLQIADFRSSSDLSAYNVGEKASGNELGIFANGEWEMSRKFALLGGLRLSGFYAGAHLIVNPEPRMSARMNIGEHSSLKASYARMYQYLHLASLSSASMPTDIWYPSTEKTLPEFSDQVSLGWSRALDRNTFFLSVEGYYKWMNNQIEFRDGANIFGNPKLENDFTYGKGNAYGLETYLEKKTGRTTGWVGYTLSWASRTFEAINNGAPFRPRYDRRHDLSFVFMHRINKKFTLSGNWIYGSGAYTTVPVGRYVFQDQVGNQTRSVIPVYTHRSNYQLAPVHRLDISLVVALKSKRGKQDLTFSLYNAYSRRNPFYIQFRELSNKEGYITAIEPTLVSLFPVLPGVTYNFKF